MTGNHVFEQDQAERNTPLGCLLQRLAVVSYFLGVTIFIQFRPVRRIPEEYLWINYSLISLIYAFSAFCLVLPRTADRRQLNIAVQAVFDVLFVTGIVLLTGGIDSVYSVLYSLVIIYSTLFLGLGAASRSRHAEQPGLRAGRESGLSGDLRVPLRRGPRFQGRADPGLHPPRGWSPTWPRFSSWLSWRASSWSRSADQGACWRRRPAFDRLDLLHRSIIESIDTGILTVQPRGPHPLLQRAAEEISGFTFGEVFNRSVEEIFPGVSAVIAQAGPDRGRQRGDSRSLSGKSGEPLTSWGLRIPCSSTA